MIALQESFNARHQLFHLVRFVFLPAQTFSQTFFSHGAIADLLKPCSLDSQGTTVSVAFSINRVGSSLADCEIPTNNNKDSCRSSVVLVE